MMNKAYLNLVSQTLEHISCTYQIVQRMTEDEVERLPNRTRSAHEFKCFH